MSKESPAPVADDWRTRVLDGLLTEFKERTKAVSDSRFDELVFAVKREATDETDARKRFLAVLEAAKTEVA